MRKSSMQPKYYSEMLQIWFPTMPFLIRSHSISKFIATAHSLFSTTGRNCWKHELDSNGVSQVNDVTCKLFWTEAIATAGIAQPQQHSNIPLKLLSALQFFHHFHWIQISPSYASESRRKHNGSTWIGPHTSLWTSSSTVHDPPSWNGLHCSIVSYPLYTAFTKGLARSWWQLDSWYSVMLHRLVQQLLSEAILCILIAVQFYIGYLQIVFPLILYHLCQKNWRSLFLPPNYSSLQVSIDPLTPAESTLLDQATMYVSIQQV